MYGCLLILQCRKEVRAISLFLAHHDSPQGTTQDSGGNKMIPARFTHVVFSLSNNTNCKSLLQQCHLIERYNSGSHCRIRVILSSVARVNCIRPHWSSLISPLPINPTSLPLIKNSRGPPYRKVETHLFRNGKVLY